MNDNKTTEMINYMIYLSEEIKGRLEICSECNIVLPRIPLLPLLMPPLEVKCSIPSSWKCWQLIALSWALL